MPHLSFSFTVFFFHSCPYCPFLALCIFVRSPDRLKAVLQSLLIAHNIHVYNHYSSPIKQFCFWSTNDKNCKFPGPFAAMRNTHGIPEYSGLQLKGSLSPAPGPTQDTPTIPQCPQSLTTAKLHQQMIAEGYWNFKSRLKVKHLPVRKGLNLGFQWLIHRRNVIFFSKALKCLLRDRGWAHSSNLDNSCDQ